MSTSPQPRSTRKERRAAERSSAPAPSTGGGGSALRSPVVLATLAALVVGAGIILAGMLTTPPSGGEPLRTPMAGLPDGIVREGRSLGAADAPVTIELYEDPQCPACGVWSRDVEPILVASAVKDGRVRLTYNDFAFLGPESLDASVAMRAAEQLDGKFWEMHALVFENQDRENKGAFSRDRLVAMAGLLGLDEAAFRALLDDPTLIAAVEADLARGRALGVASTPTLVIDGELYPGVPEATELLALIDARIAAAGSPAP